MTEKLYEKDPYGKIFQAKIVSCRKVKDNPGKGSEHTGLSFFQIVLDRTLFFPEAGGQTPDGGVICAGDREFMVQDVQIEDDVICHIASEIGFGDPLPAGTEVEGGIDWDHRYSNMQQHSGEHIFSGLVHTRFGYDNVGFHLSDHEVTMDFNGPLSAKELQEIETAANEAIYANLEVQVSYPTPEELEKIPFRSKKEIQGQVRLVTIPGIDICACCAPHVRRTGEIGILKVVGSQKNKGGVRVNILCGKRALEQFRLDRDMVARVAGEFSTSDDLIPDRIARLQAQVVQANQRRVAAEEKLSLLEAEQIPQSQRDVQLFYPEMEEIQMRKLVNLLTEKHAGYVSVYAGNDESGYRYILGIREGDARIALDQMKKGIQAPGSIKGGGSPKMIQGSITGVTEAKLRELYHF